MSHFFHRFRIPLRVQGVLFNSLPLIAILLSAGFAFFSNQQRERMELSLNRHFEMVENLAEIDTTLVNASAGVRGHLLTNDPSFLQPFTEARDLVPQKLARVRTLMESIPKETRRTEKLARLDAIQSQVMAELESLATLTPTTTPSPAENPPLSDADTRARILQNQPLLEATGKQLNDLRENEQRLLSKRIDEIRAARHRDYTLIFLSVLVGLLCRAVALYFFHRRVVRRVRQLTENVRSLRDGATLIHEPSDHADDIGDLERELARVSEYLAERRISS
jgi:CHASE3 domain sensor protein